MRISRSTLTLAVLVSVSLVFTAYTISAYYVASYVSEMGGKLWWPNTLGGAFIPWPYRPTGIAGFLTTELDQEDHLYYNYIITSGVLVALTLLLWLIVFWRVWRIRGSHNSK